MTLEQGKFYEYGELVPVEFGNKKQIELLNRVEKLRNEGEEIELEYDINHDGSKIIGASYQIECLCGKPVKFKIREFAIIEGIVKCSCGMKYQSKIEDGQFIAYLI